MDEPLTGPRLTPEFPAQGRRVGLPLRKAAGFGCGEIPSYD